MKKWILLFSGLFVSAIGIAACATSRASYETAPYKLVRTDGDFEIREYPEFKTATSPCGSGKVDNSNLMQMLRNLDGGNMAKAKRVPVVPEKKKADIPAPTSVQVGLETKKAWRVAVYRFRGARTEKLNQQAVAKLKSWMQQNKLLAAESPFKARFDYHPPWLPGFLSRNEVSAPISPL